MFKEGMNFSNSIELTKDVKFALQVAFDELSNSGEWESYLKEEEVDMVYKVMDKLRRIGVINEY